MAADKRARMRELIDTLNAASRAYYEENREIMSNFAYDALYDELEALERETGEVLPGSPTASVGYEAAKELVKERHASPMLSLDKTKSVEELASFIRGQKGLLSWKLDGLTIVLTYEGGVLLKAVTRGNGEIGEVVTQNAKTFVNLPAEIPFKGRLAVRGEAVIKYSDFERINEEQPLAEAKYKNPRNLCSGSVRQLDPSVTEKRSVNLFAFSLESAEYTDESGAEREVDFENSNEKKFFWLAKQGFEVVPYKEVTEKTMAETVALFAEEIKTYDVPSDGLVLLMDDIEYGKSLGRTAKFPRNSIAFKWKDETAETTLREIEWSPSRTGLINPIAVFDPVELEGTTVSRASLHNLSIVKSFKLGIGDRVTVYKANMIIPQIAENLTQSDSSGPPGECPSCKGEVLLKNEQGVYTVNCPNPDCPAKKIKSFVNYVSRNCMNIEGISEETLEKFTAHGLISDYSDIYHLDRHRETIVNMPGFGEKSYENIVSEVEKSRKTTPARLLAALGIPGVGRSTANIICGFFDNDFDAVMGAKEETLTLIPGVGPIIASAVVSFFSDPSSRALVGRILCEVTFEKEEKPRSASLSGLTFVITGTLLNYPNRASLIAEIESRGGACAGSVSSRTSFLINNDINSSSGKNKTAKELGIPIITEAEYRERFG